MRESRDFSAFQDMIRQLLGGMLNSAGFAGKGRVAWPRSAVSPGSPSGSESIMDWATWTRETFDLMARPRSIFLNVESTIGNLGASQVYVSDKIHIIRQLAEAPDGVPGCVRRLKANPVYGAFPELDNDPDVFLLFASNSTDHLPEPGQLLRTLREGTGGFRNPDSTYMCVPSAGSSGLLVTLPGGKGIHVGLIDRLKLVELAYLARALDGAKRHDLLDERFLFELTSLAGEPRLLDPMPRRIDVEEVTSGVNIQVDGRAVMFQRFSIEPFDLIRLCTVLRLVTDYAFLQRLPDGPHLESMAREVSTGGRFPTPVLCIPTRDVVIDSGASAVKQSGGAPVPPYQWHLVDGQHRAYCYYLVEPGRHVQNIDVNCYSLTNDHDKAVVASALFLNVNYKAIKPPIDLALAHHALALSWPRTNWVCRKPSRDCPYSDSKLYSSRILATRFLLELNEKSSLFKGFFKQPGAKDPGKSSVQSLSTYMSSEFEIRDPSDPANPLAARFGTVPGADGVWTTPDPPPGALVQVWSRLVQEFDDFLLLVTGPTGPDGNPRNANALRSLVQRNINVFVALWRVFYAYRFKRTPPGPRYPWPMLTNPARAIMNELLRLQRTGRLYGRGAAFRSGAGVARLTDALIRKFDEAGSPGAALLEDAR